VTVLAERPALAHEPEEARPSGLYRWLTSTDHKDIGRSYMYTAVVFFLLAGLMAMFIRAQLAEPDNTLLTQAVYNELFTMHGSVMLLLFAGPFAFAGFANILVPIQVGAPDMAFPRLNLLSYWLFLFGGLIMMSGFLTSGGAADFGWVAYAPLSNAVNSPGAGADLWIVALVLTGFSAIFTGVNIITTVFYLRAPGMTMFRMPIFTWNMLVTSLLILIAFPVLTSALVMLYCDRHFGTHIFEVSGGGVPVLWQHLFWFFGHPEVYIIALPYFGMVTEILPVFSKKPLFGYTGMVFATIAIAGLSTGVWAHHMFTTGVVLLPFFSGLSLLIAVPTGIKFFNWIGTMWRGHLELRTPMLFAIGFLVTFLGGGLSGVILASPPLDFFTHDTYFVVGHFHSVVAALVLAGMGGFYFWYPKFTGRMLREGLGKAQFWLMFVGMNLTFVPMYLLGLHGMPRRIAVYNAGAGWTFLNQLSTAGAYVTALSMVPFVLNLWVSWRRPREAGPNPWRYGQSLEWVTPSPPPPHNFAFLPPIRSERPAWDYWRAQEGRGRSHVGAGVPAPGAAPTEGRTEGGQPGM
jgi:cytochrome c oxidase subunit 1